RANPNRQFPPARRYAMVVSRRHALWLLSLARAAAIIRAWRSLRSPHVPPAIAPGTTPFSGGKRTTQPPCLDVVRLLPELAGHARTAVRLHPRRGPEPPRDGNKMGGTFYWPKDRPWPVCDRHRSPLVGILQLRKEDFPELGFSEREDLFQLLWCPQDHSAWTESQVYWHKRGEAPALLDVIPPPRYADDCYLAKPCLLL